MAVGAGPGGGRLMGTERARDLPARLEGVRRRFEVWRRTRRVRSRIPEPLWASAVRLAARYGVHRTAKALRVGYYSLKKRVEQEGAAGGDASPRGPANSLVTLAPRGSKTSGDVGEGGGGAAFLELAPPVQAGPCEWTLEFEAADGAKMRLHFKGVEPPDLTALGRGFWQVES